jgi:hypothetical protein
LPAAVPDTVTATYLTRRSAARLPSPSDAAATATDWIEGLPLTVSVSVDGPVPVTTVKLGEIFLLGGPDDASFGDLVAAPGNQLVVNFRLDGAGGIVCLQSPDIYIAGTATLNASGASFIGSLTSICKDQSGSGAYGWVGRATDLAAIGTMRSVLRTLIIHLQQTR